MTTAGDAGAALTPADEALFEAAASIGDRLAREAIWHEGLCTWFGDAVQHVNGDWQVVHRSCDGDLYEGTSGIALFLARLWLETGDGSHRRAAIGGARHALERADPGGPDTSFYGGTTGIAWAAVEVGRAVDAPELTAAAADLVAATDFGRPGVSCDLMSGSAGVIVGLLALARLLGRPSLIDDAVELGRRMVDSGVHDGIGLSWPADPAGEEPGLCGLGHGASGPAYALMELYGVTGERSFADASAEAVRYERAWYDRRQGNWPDLRELSREQLREGAEPAYASFWCHGAVGVGLVRARRFQLLGATTDLSETGAAVGSALLALEAARPGSGHFGANLSLCHGLGGIAELLLVSAATIGEPSHRGAAVAMLEQAAEVHGGPGATWPCGVVGGGESPGLMLGLAGIGSVLLRASASGSPPVGLPVRAGPE
jgi:lantibiotic biosynthesis protein